MDIVAKNDGVILFIMPFVFSYILLAIIEMLLYNSKYEKVWQCPNRACAILAMDSENHTKGKKTMKKALAWLLVLAMTAALAVGGTLAYLTDTDEDVNVMTVGQVRIDQLEYERVDVDSENEDADVQEFRDNKPLYPAVTEDGFDYTPGDSYVNWDQIGKDGYTSDIWDPSKINNEQDKMVFVKNKGDWDAFVRTVFAFEAGSYTSLEEYLKDVHLNLNETDWTWEWAQTPVQIGEGKYFVAVATYNKALEPDKLTEISLSQIALDSSVTNEEVLGFGDTFQVLVQSQAVQADGFIDADTALNEAFGEIIFNAGTETEPKPEVNPEDEDFPFANDNPTKGTDVKTAIHYLNASPTGTVITDSVTSVVFGKASAYPEVVNNYKGYLMDVEQDTDAYAYYVQGNAKAPNYTVYILSDGVVHAPKSCYTLFNKMSNLVNVDSSNLDTSRTEDMTAMFQKCISLKTLDVSDWDTSNVTNMTGTFVNCNAIESIVGLENWDTSNVTNMYRMFDQCNKLKSFNGTGWDMENVTSTQHMFRNCNTMTEVIGTKDWYMPNNTTCYGMFLQCAKLTSVDVHNWDMSSVTSVWDMFCGCPELITVPGIGNWKMGNVEYAISMFYGCYKLAYLDDLSGWDMRKALDIGFMFESCYVLSEINGIGEWEFENLEKMGWMFEGCYALTELDIGDWDVSKVQTFNNLFASHNQNKGDMQLKKLDLSKWNPASATTMAAMFYGCGHLTELDLSGWNMPNLTTVSHMMSDCFNLEVIDVSGWQTPSLTCMDAMFNDCRKVKMLDMSSFDTSNVREFSQIFEVCYALEEIKGLENWDTSKGQDFSEIFSGCGSLKELNLSSFDTRNADPKYLSSGQYENWVFLRFMSGCSGLQKVTFGPYFDFDGIGNCPSSYKFSMASASGVEGWDGKWYNAETGEAFAPSEIPELTAATYVAVKPE